jgi:uncharacterized protein (TIGR02449 family)
MATLDDLTARIERLLLRFDELQRTNRLLDDKLQSALSERDALRARLAEARARVDALLSKLPDDVPLVADDTPEMALRRPAS